MTEVGTWQMVIADMQEREVLGISRYGRLLTPNNGRDSLQDAYEEALDLAVYLKNEMREKEAAKCGEVQRNL